MAIVAREFEKKSNLRCGWSEDLPECEAGGRNHGRKGIGKIQNSTAGEDWLVASCFADEARTPNQESKKSVFEVVGLKTQPREKEDGMMVHCITE
jgi:hypothetical protein